MLPYHIKAYDPRLKAVIQFWLYSDSEEEIYKILKRKHKLNKKDVEWIKLETPPFA